MQVQQIDLLKLDVEGHELDVLKGAQSMLEQGQCPLKEDLPKTQDFVLALS